MPKWTSEENQFLMQHAYREPWRDIAYTLGRSEVACKAHWRKIAQLQKRMGTWKGIAR